jgi:hypothetical protein
MTHANASACASKLARREAYSTGQVARLLGCSGHAVTNWVDRGSLPAQRLPAPEGGVRARRIFHDDLVAFCRAHGLARALAALEGPPPPPGPVALCGLPDALTAVLASRLGQGAAAWYPDLLTLGLAFARTPPPRAVVLGGCHGRGTALDAVRALAGLDPRPLLVGLPGEDDGPEAWTAAGCDRVFQVPCDAARVAEVLTP